MFESRRKANAARKTAQIVAIILASLALLLVLLGLTVKSALPIYVGLLVFVIAGLAFASRATTWSAGADGEEKGAQHLSLLGNSYRVIHDVVLPRMRGNIDHVVLGFNGVFVIETKNHRGFIKCNGDLWMQHKVGQLGTPYLGNIGCPSKQARRYAVLLRNFIQERLDINLYVNCIVVFTNKDAMLRIDNSTVTVLKLNELNEFIKNHHSEVFLSNQELGELEATIRPYSRFY